MRDLSNEEAVGVLTLSQCLFSLYYSSAAKIIFVIIILSSQKSYPNFSASKYPKKSKYNFYQKMNRLAYEHEFYS